MGKIKIEKSSENQLFNYKSRLEILLNLTTENILITKLENIFYLTGFKGSAGWLFISNAQKYLLVDSRYFEVASQVTDNTNVVLVANLYEDTLYLLLEELSIKQFTIAKNSLYLNEYDNIVSKMTSHSIKVSTTNIDIDIASEEEVFVYRNCFMNAIKNINGNITDEIKNKRNIYIYYYSYPTVDGANVDEITDSIDLDKLHYNTLNSYNLELYNELKSEKASVAVHVRLGDSHVMNNFKNGVI